jgi:hypothetical protein
VASAQDQPGDANPEPTATPQAAASDQNDTQPGDSDVPEGPALPAIFGLIGSMTGMELELDTADDLLHLRLPEAMASQIGVES